MNNEDIEKVMPHMRILAAIDSSICGLQEAHSILMELIAKESGINLGLVTKIVNDINEDLRKI